MVREFRRGLAVSPKLASPGGGIQEEAGIRKTWEVQSWLQVKNRRSAGRGMRVVPGGGGTIKKKKKHKRMRIKKRKEKITTTQECIQPKYNKTHNTNKYLSHRKHHLSIQ